MVFHFNVPKNFNIEDLISSPENPLKNKDGSVTIYYSYNPGDKAISPLSVAESSNISKAVIELSTNTYILQIAQIIQTQGGLVRSLATLDLNQIPIELLKILQQERQDLKAISYGPSLSSQEIQERYTIYKLENNKSRELMQVLASTSTTQSLDMNEGLMQSYNLGPELIKALENMKQVAGQVDNRLTGNQQEDPLVNNDTSHNENQNAEEGEKASAEPEFNIDLASLLGIVYNIVALITFVSAIRKRYPVLWKLVMTMIIAMTQILFTLVMILVSSTVVPEGNQIDGTGSSSNPFFASDPDNVLFLESDYVDNDDIHSNVSGLTDFTGDLDKESLETEYNDIADIYWKVKRHADNVHTINRRPNK